MLQTCSPFYGRTQLLNYPPPSKCLLLIPTLSCRTQNLSVYWCKHVQRIPQTLRYVTGTDQVTAMATSHNALRRIISAVKNVSEICQAGLQRSSTKYVQDLLLFSVLLFKIIHTKEIPIIPFCDMDRTPTRQNTNTPAHQHSSTPAHQHTSTSTH